jgi:putative two-component system response regulator
MSKRILFVDDEPNVLNAIRRMLHGKAPDWQLVFAEGVDPALEKVAEMRFDAVVTDVNMPMKTGFDLLEALQADEKTREIPVVILTGNAEQDLKRKALDMGATDLLNKPSSTEDLIARIRSVLRLKDYQDQLKRQNEILEEKVKERTHDLAQSRIDILWRLAKAGEHRDEETGNHVLRVSQYSAILARGLGLDEKTVERIAMTSPLHDIGKIGIPDAILLKAGPLTDQERGVMKSHCEIGARILMEAPKGVQLLAAGTEDTVPDGTANPLLDMAAEIVMSHHERWDGKGYPNGIAGEDIPISGRIVALADVYDALGSERPYKKAFPESEVLAIIDESKGHHFDPDLVVIFKRVLPELRDVQRRLADV